MSWLPTSCTWSRRDFIIFDSKMRWLASATRSASGDDGTASATTPSSASAASTASRVPEGRTRKCSAGSSSRDAIRPASVASG
ncbi:hypothetical protein COSO111634_31305 [Corallococcus soli]